MSSIFFSKNDILLNTIGLLLTILIRHRNFSDSELTAEIRSDYYLRFLTRMRDHRLRLSTVRSRTNRNRFVLLSFSFSSSHFFWHEWQVNQLFVNDQCGVLDRFMKSGSVEWICDNVLFPVNVPKSQLHEVRNETERSFFVFSKKTFLWKIKKTQTLWKTFSYLKEISIFSNFFSPKKIRNR